MIISSASIRRTPSHYTSAKLPNGSFVMVPHFASQDELFATSYKGVV